MLACWNLFLKIYLLTYLKNITTEKNEQKIRAAVRQMVSARVCVCVGCAGDGGWGTISWFTSRIVATTGAGTVGN